MSKQKKLFYTVILLQVLVLLGITLSFYAVGWLGKEIRIKTAPIDPRDLFYGDYVVLNYEISLIPEELWKGHENPKAGDAMYVVLEQVGEYYEVAAAYPDKPNVIGDQLILKGKYDRFQRWGDPPAYRVSYGLERYYVPEGTGKEIEERGTDVDVAIKIAPWGQAKISGLIYK